jgi:hypothetical protein
MWMALYLCFLDAPLGSELNNVYLFALQDATEQQATLIYKKYCHD